MAAASSRAPENVQVFCRFRGGGGALCPQITIDENTVSVANEFDDTTKLFVYNGVFGVDSTDSEIYTAIGQPALQAVLSGYNATIMFYGLVRGFQKLLIAFICGHAYV